MDIGTKEGMKVTLVGLVVNVVLVGAKFWAGVVGSSQALIADALHSISDLVTDVIVLAGLKLGRKQADKDHHFGHARFETLAALGVGLGLVAAAVFIGKDSVMAIYHHEEHHPTWLAVAIAFGSVLAKELLYRYTIIVGRSIKSRAMEANAWHHRSDALSSAAVLAGVLAAQLNPDWHILDSVAALAVSVLIIKVAFELMLGALKELSDASPPPEVVQKMLACASAVDGVEQVHDLKARILGGSFQVELHVVVNSQLSVRGGHRIAKEVESCLLRDIENITQIIIHVDPD